MSKKVIASNGSPRVNWNTAQLVSAAADGAKEAGAEEENLK
jgi:multimeric flavodoxin WrbA